ncbi:MAG: hypothetical protein SVK54_02950, partial [candidate division WOR-3 bacterium]|nr:hypothetical protein [candidate division WOR-3 bacterium]
MPRTLAVVLNYNGAVNTADTYLQCIDSLTEQSVKTDILLIDNHSTDNSIESIRSQFPHVNIIANKKALKLAYYMVNAADKDHGVVVENARNH